jgi:hypothetical protein
VRIAGDGRGNELRGEISMWREENLPIVHAPEQWEQTISSFSPFSPVVSLYNNLDTKPSCATVQYDNVRSPSSSTCSMSMVLVSLE